MKNQAEYPEERLVHWYRSRNWKPFPFQLEMAEAYATAPGGLLNAPTGSGKTFALALPVLLQAAAENDTGKGLRLLWITPLKALSKDIA
ncbi:MAG: DEAD/DEAH box helicase, partial [Bacteroidia bacterium]